MNRGVAIPGLSRRLRAGIYDHVYDNHTHEVGGVLVGQLGDGDMPRVTGCIAALEARGERASVTFTHDAWESIHAGLERDFPGDQIIGWYHSHPGFGIFLSNHDLFIHENFFSDPRQIAYVVDPHAGTEGVFGWRDGKVTVLEEGPAARRGTGGAAPASESRGDWMRYGGLALVLALMVGVAAGLLIMGGVSDPPVGASPSSVTTTSLPVPGVATAAPAAPPPATTTDRRPATATVTQPPATTTQPASTQPAGQPPPAQAEPAPPPPPPPPPLPPPGSGGTPAVPPTSGDSGGASSPGRGNKR